MVWPLSKIVDFECLIERPGADQDPIVPAVAALSKQGVTDRSKIFAAWVDRENHQLGTPTPGRSLESGIHWASWVAGVACFVIGGSVCAGLLLYYGDRPVNVGLFLFGTVGLQVLLLIIMGLVCLSRRRRGRGPVTALLRWLSKALGGARSKHLSGKQRQAAHTVIAKMEERSDLYGGVLIWPAVAVAQIGGICWNLGLLAVLLLRVAVMDLAFAWESTLEAGADDVHHIVSVLAAPWSWLPSAQPDLTQIAASQFEHKTGIKAMNTSAMRAWWPFLAYVIAFYGLLPRIILLAWASWRGYKARAALKFDHPMCNELYRRLMPPLTVSGAAGPELKIPDVPSRFVSNCGKCWVLVSDEVSVNDDEIKAKVARSYGWNVGALDRIEADNPLGNQEVLEVLRRSTNLVGIVVVLSAYRPPIVGVARTLALAREALNSAGGGEVTLLLVGREGSAVDLEDLDHWRKFNAIHKLGYSLATWES